MNRNHPQNTPHIAIPGEIKLTERYSYVIEKSHLPSIKEHEEPTGKIEIIVPYDDWLTLSRHAGLPEDFILFENFQHTNLDFQLRELLWYGGGNAFPLSQILNHAIRNPPDLTDEHLSRRITIEYDPESLKYPIVEITSKIYDQSKIDDLSDILWDQERHLQSNIDLEDQSNTGVEEQSNIDFFSFP